MSGVGVCGGVVLVVWCEWCGSMSGVGVCGGVVLVVWCEWCSVSGVV